MQDRMSAAARTLRDARGTLQCLQVLLLSRHASHGSAHKKAALRLNKPAQVMAVHDADSGKRLADPMDLATFFGVVGPPANGFSDPYCAPC